MGEVEAEAESASAQRKEGEREEMEEEEGQDERNREREMQGAMGRGAPVFSLKPTVFSEEVGCIISAAKQPESVVFISPPSESCLVHDT